MTAEVLTFLIVEDDPDLLSIVSDYVRHCGYTVWSVCEGQGALALAAIHDIDIAMLDVVMPGLLVGTVRGAGGGERMLKETGWMYMFLTLLTKLVAELGRYITTRTFTRIGRLAGKDALSVCIATVIALMAKLRPVHEVVPSFYPQGGR